MTPHTQSVPYGYCHCLCGGRTNLHRQSETARGYKRGEPKLFIAGHQNRIFPEIVEAAPFKIEGVYCRLIPLTQGMYAIVDEVDYYRLMRWKWSALRRGNAYYAVRSVRINGKQIPVFMHLVVSPSPDGLTTDHENGVSLDNRRNNLRPANRSQQAWNKRKPKTNTSGYKGVSWAPGSAQWQTRIGIGYKRINLGLFGQDKLAAALAYDRAARELHGEFANLNFPDSVNFGHATSEKISGPE